MTLRSKNVKEEQWDLSEHGNLCDILSEEKKIKIFPRLLSLAALSFVLFYDSLFFYLFSLRRLVGYMIVPDL